MTQPQRSINWALAPEGSTHYVADCTDPWHKIVDGAAWYWSARHENWLPYTHVRRAMENVIRDGIARPAEPTGNPDWPTEERIDIIGTKGNEGGHCEEGEGQATLLPPDWLVQPARARRVRLGALAQKNLSQTGDPGRRLVQGFLHRHELKLLGDISDDVFEISRAHVLVALLPVLVKDGPVEWDEIDRITREEMAMLEKRTDRVLQGYSLNFEIVEAPRQFPAEGYERLHAVYRDAHDHAAYTKGKERHANDLPFHEQRMQTISQGLNSPDGMAYQVIKKLQEGLQMKDAGARRRELLGAANYLAGIVIFLDDQEAGGDV